MSSTNYKMKTAIEADITTIRRRKLLIFPCKKSKILIFLLRKATYAMRVNPISESPNDTTRFP